MKLSTYAKKLGISYKTAYRHYKKGILNGYQLPTGTIIVPNEILFDNRQIIKEIAKEIIKELINETKP